MTTKLLIIGGSDAGISAGLRARELAPGSKVTIVVADRFANYSMCGLPFYLSGEVPDWHALAHRTSDEMSETGVHLLLDCTAQAIDPISHCVSISDEDGQARLLAYDRVIMATGPQPVRPHLVGLDLPGVFLLRCMVDAFAVQQYLEAQTPRAAVIIGGGYSGMEMADALTRWGLSVTVVEHAASVLKTVASSLASRVRAE